MSPKQAQGALVPRNMIQEDLIFFDPIPSQEMIEAFGETQRWHKAKEENTLHYLPFWQLKVEEKYILHCMHLYQLCKGYPSLLVKDQARQETWTWSTEVHNWLQACKGYL